MKESDLSGIVAAGGDGLPVLGNGRRARVVLLDDGRVLKLYHPDVDPAVPRLEYTHARAVMAAGLPTWRADALLEAGGRQGIVGSHEAGMSLSRAMQRRPWRLRGQLARLAALQARLHAARIDEAIQGRVLPNGRVEDYLRDIPPDLAAPIAAAIAADDAVAFCHGDFHGRNIVLGAAGMIILDWDRSGLGSAALDTARTLGWLTLGPNPRRRIGWGELRFRHWLAKIYLADYCRASGADPRAITAWWLVEIIRRRPRGPLTGPALTLVREMAAGL